MLVYYLVLAAVIFIAAADNRLHFNIEQKIGKQAFILIALLLICVAGLRYGVGADYFFYYENYDFYRTSELVLNEEPIYKILARISAIIYKDPAALMFICAALTIGIMLVPIYKNSVMPLLSVILFLFLGTWHGTFNGIRQYLAAAVLFAGHRFIKEKNFWKWCLVVLAAYFCHVTAAEILKDKIPNLKILFAGNGPKEEELLEQIKTADLKDNIIMLGYRTDLENIVPAVDLVVSCSRREGLGLNVIEAMLSQKAVVATINRGHSEIIKNGKNGYLVSIDDFDAMSEKIYYLYKNKDKLTEMGIKGYDLVQIYTVNNVKKELSELIM